MCERIITDAMTKQTSLIGIIAHIEAADFPVRVPHLTLFAELTNGRGLVPLSVRIVDANEANPPLFKAEAKVPMEHPLSIGQFALAFGGLVFPEAGEYRAQLHCGEELLLERRIVLMPIQRGSPGAQSGQ